MSVPTRSQQNYRDRDIFRDAKDRIYVTLGHIQPKDGIISTLKYVPDRKGKWQSQGIRYRRVFSNNVESVTGGQGILPDDYYDDSHFGIPLLKFPKHEVTQYYSPEKRLESLLETGCNDPLEQTAVELSQILHDNLDIPFNHLGVTGSIAWHAHNPGFSDINLNIHGYEWSWILEQGYSELVEENTELQMKKGNLWDDSIARAAKRIPVLRSSALKRLFTRRTQLMYNGHGVTIMPVLYSSESPIRYGSEKYYTLDLVISDFKIKSSRYGIFFPAIYDVTGEVQYETQILSINRLLIYDGTFRGLFHPEDQIQVCGTLQRVESSEQKSPFHQIMIGTKSGSGREFIKLTRPSQSYL
ncbi:MAG: hypothetical protein GF411_06765 [Candidatus Lokiarchaeota archaeon]|nr:hypothetical protein [Candidatus Lokiarchaeota archaeon]